MERTKSPEGSSNLVYSVEEEPIVLSKPLLDTFLSKPNPADLIGLYCFYYYTAKWQKTNQPKATTNYSAKGMKWSDGKIRAVKKVLKELKLIEDITSRGEGNRVTGHYIKVNFIWRFHPNDFPECGTDHSMEILEGNALSTNKENALSTNKETSSSDSPHLNGQITSSQFEDFWELYPKKTDKGKALTKWNQICNKKPFDRPSWKQIKIAIIRQRRSERWQDPKFIPHPTTWLNQSRWLDDPAEMKTHKRDNNKSDNIQLEPSNDFMNPSWKIKSK